MRRLLPVTAVLVLAVGAVGMPAVAQDGQSGQPIVIPETFVSPEALTKDTPVDTSVFKQEAPWKLCVSAGYLFNSWVVFALQNIRYQASLEPSYEPDIVVTDAGFDASKQVSDIADLINQGCEAIIYWPVDDKAIEPGLEQAVAAGIPTVNVGGGYADMPGITSNAHIDQYQLGVAVALQLAEALGGEGKIVSMLPIAGTTAAVNQDRALREVLAGYPGIEILDTQNGDWNRAQAKDITENWLLQFPQIDGAFSPAGQMSVGMAEAFDEAGRLGEVTFSPGDEYNGWLKWIAAHPESNGGVVTFPPSAGAVGVQQMTRILNGEEVTKGIQVPSVWYAPEDAAALADPAAPDDWWASDLPAEFLPQQ
jgi:ABC-type sugar transport system substrate-binding protein